ncbi:Attachment protein shaft domain [Trinorchestia longiramus]|nr:Attachment protein shaft domain [Trinorchestia longiramus]
MPYIQACPNRRNLSGRHIEPSCNKNGQLTVIYLNFSQHKQATYSNISPSRNINRQLTAAHLTLSQYQQATYGSTFNPLSIPTGNPLSIATGNPLSIPTGNPLSIPTGNPLSIPTGNPLSIPTSNLRQDIQAFQRGHHGPWLELSCPGCCRHSQAVVRPPSSLAR